MRTRSSFQSLFAQVTLVGGLVVALVLLIVKPGLADGTPVAPGALTDQGGGTDEAGRVRFGQIFIGTVVAVAGEESVSTSDPTDNIPIILYDVDVSQTLKGEAAGRVRIWYSDFDAPPFDYPAVGKLQVGMRYLFFAGFNPDEQRYPVGDGVGVIPIADDQEEAHLVATFQPLIKDYAQEAKSIPAADPCEQVGQPEVRVLPQKAQSGDMIEVSATNLVRPQVSIWWDDAGEACLAVADVQADCSLTVEVVIPKAEPGKHQILVQDARGKSAVAEIAVTD
jgi:hypothetical protein